MNWFTASTVTTTSSPGQACSVAIPPAPPAPAAPPRRRRRARRAGRTVVPGRARRPAAAPVVSRAAPAAPAAPPVPPVPIPPAGQSFAAPFVELTVLTNGPVPFGQRPYVIAACAVQLYVWTIAPVGS